ncbi:MAG: phenylacrylic acid decarboxylase, 3-octaprenyl-4-hydroxybenzoate carboxy-lyase [Pseudomonadota bacterium]|jgi:4-hydroxy-3-polyprenylbenzoate decarboxylase
MKKLIIGITGASGTEYGIKLLQLLKPLDVETHLIISSSAKITMQYECEKSYQEICDLADIIYKNENIAAKVASGSFKTDGMIIAPCSIKTMSEIAYGQTSNLMSRAADVVLKERRKLVLSVRESPLHAGHIETMLKVTNMGAIIAPPVLALYAKPQSIDDAIEYSAVRMLDLFDIDSANVNRWSGTNTET